ncbi:MAG: hypothetical protein ACR2HA_07950 [Nocardioides sp.]
MTEAVAVASWLVTGLAVAVGAVALAATHEVRSSLALLLDLLLAAGLLRLSADSEWSVLGTAAAIVVLRRLVVVHLPGRSATATRPSAKRRSATSGH